jgi:hypothetical protein
MGWLNKNGRFPPLKQGKFKVGVSSPCWQTRLFTTILLFFVIMEEGSVAVSAGANTSIFQQEESLFNSNTGF